MAINKRILDKLVKLQENNTESTKEIKELLGEFKRYDLAVKEAFDLYNKAHKEPKQYFKFVRVMEMTLDSTDWWK